jgi:hypothetical protein
MAFEPIKHPRRVYFEIRSGRDAGAAPEATPSVLPVSDPAIVELDRVAALMRCFGLEAERARHLRHDEVSPAYAQPDP